MAMGGRDGGRAEPRWIATAGIRRSPGNVCDATLNRVLTEHRFDGFWEDLCRPFSAARGRGRARPRPRSSRSRLP